MLLPIGVFVASKREEISLPGEGNPSNVKKVVTLLTPKNDSNSVEYLSFTLTLLVANVTAIAACFRVANVLRLDFSVVVLFALIPQDPVAPVRDPILPNDVLMPPVGANLLMLGLAYQVFLPM